jgi:hypothetical protein
MNPQMGQFAMFGLDRHIPIKLILTCDRYIDTTDDYAVKADYVIDTGTTTDSVRDPESGQLYNCVARIS